MGRYFAIVIGWLSLVSSAAAQVAIPPELQNWREWVLHDYPHINCPYFLNQTKKTCDWPSRLDLQLGDAGGQFELRVETFAPAWVVLPGADGFWPQQVTDRGEALPVVRRDGTLLAATRAARAGLAIQSETARVGRERGLPTTLVRGAEPLPGTAPFYPL